MPHSIAPSILLVVGASGLAVGAWGIHEIGVVVAASGSILIGVTWLVRLAWVAGADRRKAWDELRSVSDDVKDVGKRVDVYNTETNRRLDRAASKLDQLTTDLHSVKTEVATLSATCKERGASCELLRQQRNRKRGT